MGIPKMACGQQGQEAVHPGSRRTIEGPGGRSPGRKRISKTPDMRKIGVKGIIRLC